uniref:Gustatory receptor n=1 Tax=Panagrolaimus sp. JU765 TaxID=591449 RepID=A0AC34PW77_9BILA
MHNETMLLEPPKFYPWIQTAIFASFFWDGLFLVVACICTLIVVTIGLVQYVYINLHVNNEIIKHYLTWLAFMLPITAITSILGMLFPRSSTFLNILGVCYLMICLTVIIRLMNYLFGSRVKIVQYMVTNRLKLDPNVLPFCNILPKWKPTLSRICRVEKMVYQTSFVRITTGVILLIAVLDRSEKLHLIENYVNALNIISVAISAWGFEMLKKIGEEHLKPQRFGSFYNFVNIAHTIFTLQENISMILMKFDVFETGPLLTTEARSNYVASLCYCIEALILSISSLFVFHPKTNQMFNDTSSQGPTDEVEIPMLELERK